MSDLPSHDEVLRAVGGALSNWSLVELQLSTLFAMASDIPNQAKSSHLFAAIISFDARLSVCDVLMQHEAIYGLESEMWAKLSAKLSRSYKKRHELAHFSINFDAAEKPVISPFLTDSKLISGTVRHLTLEQIRERSQKFIELHMAVAWFSQRAFWRRAQPDKDPPQDSPEPQLVTRLRALATQSLEERR